MIQLFRPLQAFTRPLAALVMIVGLQATVAPLAQAQIVTAPAPTSAPAKSNTAPDHPSETQERLTSDVDNLATQLKTIETGVDVTRPTKSLLADLEGQVQPLIAKSKQIVDRLTPRVAAVKARIDQLGPAPDAKAPAENADVKKERISLQKTFDDNDGLLKRAKVLQLKAEQDAAYIGKRQRSLFTTSLFQRSTSLLSPPLWLTVAKETPSNITDTINVFDGWIDGFNRNLGGGKLIAFWAMVMIVVILYWPLTHFAKRLVRRDPKIDKPNTWQKIILACWTSFSVAGAMIAIMYGVVYVFSFFAAPDPRVTPLFAAMQSGIVRIALAAGLARGVLAPRRSKWRLVNLDDTTADKLVRIVVGVALIVSATKVIEAINDVIYASLEFSVAARGIGALLVAGGLAAALFDLGDEPEADNPDAGDASPSTQRREWYGLIRGIAWTLILVITGAVLVGYVPFASFLVDQVVLVAATGAVLYLLVRLIDKACELGFQPTSFAGRNLIYTVGMRRETLGQLSILLSGAARLLLIGLALIAVSAPWGMQSSDISGNLNAIFFGFKVGDVTISVAGIAVAIISFLLVLAATRAVQNWLEDRYLPQTRLDAGLRNSIKTSLGYVGFIIALVMAAGNLGVDFQKLAIVAGALSVGIGFGLQSIVNNFVSGLILLWERAVRVGDWVIVGADQGYVRRINVRSTEIETFDRASVIVPNSNLVSGVVKNLMRTDRVGRLTIEVTAHITADADKVRDVLIDIARDNEAVLSLPSPQVRFITLTSSAMTFNLFCFVGDVENSLRTKSDLYFEICKQFRQNGFFDGPAPDPTAINILGFDKLEGLLKAKEMPDIEPARSRMTG